MAPEHDLDQLPTKNGFRMRGLGMTRVETFTDAAFAFAVTLLVISVDAVPSSYDGLVEALKGVPAFGLSFLLLMMFWYGHWTRSRRFGLEDGPTIVLSCLLVFLVLCYIYPLRMLFSGMAGWFTGGRLGGELTLRSANQLYDLFVIYGIGFTAMASTIVLLNVHAYRHRDTLELSALERFDTRAEIVAWLVLAAVGLISILLALVTPASGLALPGWIYATLSIAMPLLGGWQNRKRRSLETVLAQE